jgi:hypothetical protein
VDLFGVGAGGAVDARVVDAGEHQHLVVGLVAKIARLAHLIHTAAVIKTILPPPIPINHPTSPSPN